MKNQHEYIVSGKLITVRMTEFLKSARSMTDKVETKEEKAFALGFIGKTHARLLSSAILNETPFNTIDTYVIEMNEIVFDLLSKPEEKDE